MSLSLMVAMARNRVIGKDNQIPWHLSEDLRRFKQITLGHKIIMGRKTFESLGKALPGRENIVLTSQKGFSAPGVTVIHDLLPVKKWMEADEEIFVIGGAKVYEQLLPYAQKIYLTLIDQDFSGDTFLPEFDAGLFTLKEGPVEKAGNGLTYQFKVYERKKHG